MCLPVSLAASSLADYSYRYYVMNLVRSAYKDNCTFFLLPVYLHLRRLGRDLEVIR